MNWKRRKFHNYTQGWHSGSHAIAWAAITTFVCTGFLRPPIQNVAFAVPRFCVNNGSIGTKRAIGIKGNEAKMAQAENPVHMLNWAVRSVKFLGVEFDQSEDEEVSVSDAAHL